MFTATRVCTCCNKTYQVELRKMRLNIHNFCPLCGFPNSISEKEAFNAQRLLERLERETRIAEAA